MKYILSILIVIFFISCKKTNQGEIEEQSLKIVSSDTVIKSRIKLLDLNSEVSKKLKGVSSYTLLHQKIDSISKAPFKEIEALTLGVNDNILDLKNTLPNTLKSKPILSRLNQLKTYSLLLQDKFANKSSNLEGVNNTIIQLLESYNLMIVQLNDVENKIPEDFQKQLEKAAFERDSLKQYKVAPLF